MQTFTVLPRRWWVARAFERNAAWHAGVVGVTAAITMWLAVVAAATGLTALVRWRLNRFHSADWDRELCSLEERRST